MDTLRASMPGSADRQPRVDPRTARTTAAILDAAEPLFREHGFHGTTIDTVAAGAGVSPGSVYFHFSNKETLYLALVERALDINATYMAEAYAPERSPLQQVLAAGDAYLRFHLEQPGYFRMIALRPFDTSASLEEAEARIADRVEGLVGAVGDALARAVATGEAEVEDPHDAAVFLWGAWNGVVALTLRADRLRLTDDRVQEVLAAGREIVLRGVAPRTS